MVNALAFAIAIGWVCGLALCPPFSGSLGIHTILNAAVPGFRFALYGASRTDSRRVHEEFSGVKPRYGFTGLYAYASSEALFGRRQYLIIALRRL
jgi:hypothetical protein